MMPPASGASARLQQADEFVVLLSNRRAAPVEILEIQYSYVTWAGGESLFAVFKTTDNHRAVAACCA